MTPDLHTSFKDVRYDAPMRGIKREGCTVQDCDRPHFGRGMCNLHYNRWRREGTTDLVVKERSVRQCGIEGCEKKHFVHGFCAMHWRRVKVTGTAGPSGMLRPASERGVITSYSAAHAKVYRVRGAASEYLCIDCQKPAEEWAYRHPVAGEFAWSDDPNDYDPKCRSCHRTGDKAHNQTSQKE